MRGGTLTLSLGRDANGLDPHYGTTGTTSSYAACFYNQLWRPTLASDGTMSPQPELAESWEWLNPMTLLFKLRNGVQFHDGSEFDASVAKWNYDRVMAPESPGAFRQTYTRWIQSTQAIDKYTFEITLTEPNQLFFDDFVPSPATYMMSPAYVQRVGDTEVARTPMGTGPFRFVEWVQNDHLSCRPFENYWDTDSFGVQRPYVDELVWKPIGDITALFNALRAGTSDWIYAMLPTDVQTAKNDPNLKISVDPGGYQWMDLQVLTPPFNDQRLRQALNWAIDRQAILRGIYLGQGDVPTTRLPKTHWATDPSEVYYSFDPAKAKDLLAQAGVPNGFSFEIVHDNTAIPSALGQAVQAQLKELGIQVSLSPIAPAAYAPRINGGTDWQAGIQDLSGFPPVTGPDLPNLGMPNPGYGQWKGLYATGLEAKSLLTEARQATDRTKAKELYAQVAQIVRVGAGVVNLHQTANISGMRIGVMGYQAAPSPYDQFPDRIWLQR
jgi:peptide/nickel transport system substrate-binding protein